MTDARWAGFPAQTQHQRLWAWCIAWGFRAVVTASPSEEWADESVLNRQLTSFEC